MNKNSKFSRLYVNYIIKTPIIFYAFLALGITLFLFLSIGLKLDVVKSEKGIISDNIIAISGEYTPTADVVYIYNDRNEKIYKLQIINCEIENGKTIIEIKSDATLSGEMNVDIVIGGQSLFERIFAKAGKG